MRGPAIQLKSFSITLRMFSCWICLTIQIIKWVRHINTMGVTLKSLRIAYAYLILVNGTWQLTSAEVQELSGPPSKSSLVFDEVP